MHDTWYNEQLKIDRMSVISQMVKLLFSYAEYQWKISGRICNNHQLFWNQKDLHINGSL